jgi:hypothetical protein
MSRTIQRMAEQAQSREAARTAGERVRYDDQSERLADALWRAMDPGISNSPAARAKRPAHAFGEVRLADQPVEAALVASPVLPHDIHRKLVAESLVTAEKLGKIVAQGAAAINAPVDGVFSLAQWQSPFKQQNNRGTCWAFAGAAALEAAYRRKYNIAIDVSEEYVFHMGKSFALNRDSQQAVVTPVENNSSLTGFQGSGDIVQKLSENAAAPEGAAPYLQTQEDLVALLPVLGLPNVQALTTQEQFDAIEFCEQHVPLVARVNARYRATGWKSLGANPSIEALENTLLAEHEVVCDVTTPAGGHVLLLIGFNRNRKVFFAKNHWGENRFIEIQYANDPNWTIDSGWYFEDVVDPSFVQNEACWLGNWWAHIGANSFRMILRRSEDFAAPGTPTKLGTAYLADGGHDVNGEFLDNGNRLRLFIAPSTAPVPPGTLSGMEIDARLDFSDIYNVAGQSGDRPVAMSRFGTRFAAIFEEIDGTPWQARHGIDSKSYQATFDALVRDGYRLTNVCGYSHGRGSRFNAIWQKRRGPAWQARHGLSAAQYQATFDSLAKQGYRLVNISGYAEDGQARYAAIWEQRQGPEWQARHGMNREQYQQTFDQMAARGFDLVQVCGYRVNVEVLFAAIWEKKGGVAWQARHGLTSSAYQAVFDQQAAAGMKLTWVSGYSDTGIARYAGIWRQESSGGRWHARHGMDAAGYQHAFDEMLNQNMRPAMVVGYGDGFYPA